MASLRHEHTAARREALQLLYTSELTGAPLSGLVGGDEQELLLVPECPQGVSDADLVGVDLVDYASTLVDGIVEHDRNIIRIATYEIVYCDDIPTGVTINEAVEMAKAFGTDESPKFVNGVLGRIATETCGGIVDELDEDALQA